MEKRRVAVVERPQVITNLFGNIVKEHGVEPKALVQTFKKTGVNLNSAQKEQIRKKFKLQVQF
jgi:hypothetical protein